MMDVPFHLSQARTWRRNSWLWFASFAAQAGLLVWTQNWWYGMFAVCTAFSAGGGFHRARSEMHSHLMDAWDIETEQTLRAMARSGLHDDPIDAMEALRDGPPMPGFSRRRWYAMNDEIVERLRKERS